jgi:hypothetical protein
VSWKPPENRKISPSSNLLYLLARPLTEPAIGVAVLNRMFEAGRPDSVRRARHRIAGQGRGHFFRS